MTEKQQSILNAALELFSSKGYDAVSTSQIAQKAAVSEGLIFRHFKNKLGLLEAIMDLGQQEITPYVEQIAHITNPQEKIQSIMELPFFIKEDQYPLWRLIYSLKWQKQYYDDYMAQPLKELLVVALNELSYDEPEAEADLILAYLDGFATTILLKRNEVDKDKLLQTLRKKYIK